MQISKAKADKDQNDPALDQANITAMKEAKAALVSIVDLKAALNEAAQHKAGTYTVSSYKLLKDAVTNAEPLKDKRYKRKRLPMRRLQPCGDQGSGQTCSWFG